MSVFQLPKALCRSLNSMMTRFWRGHKANHSRISWMSWERMNNAKSIGGLGFWDLALFNKALLVKQGWRILNNLDSLVARILKDKYYPSGEFLVARRALKLGLGWHMGNGESIKIWGDAWLPSLHSRLLSPPHPSMDPNAKVACLIDNASRWWNFELIQRLFNPGDMARICSIGINPHGKPDRLIWKGNASGVFLVKSAYYLMMTRHTQETGECSREIGDALVWQSIWSFNAPPMVWHFSWKVCNNLLPTKSNLALKKIVPIPDCPICLREPETVVHCLWSFPAAVAVWQECSRRL